MAREQTNLMKTQEHDAKNQIGQINVAYYVEALRMLRLDKIHSSLTQ